jgi:hypothetical protein
MRAVVIEPRSARRSAFDLAQHDRRGRVVEPAVALDEETRARRISGLLTYRVISAPLTGST